MSRPQKGNPNMSLNELSALRPMFASAYGEGHRAVKIIDGAIASGSERHAASALQELAESSVTAKMLNAKKSAILARATDSKPRLAVTITAVPSNGSIGPGLEKHSPRVSVGYSLDDSRDVRVTVPLDDATGSILHGRGVAQWFEQHALSYAPAIRQGRALLAAGDAIEVTVTP